jgi:hypothetical protein
MSESLSILQAAVRQFVNRPTEEKIDPDELRDVVDAVEGELEKLYETPAERAAQDEALARALRDISETYGSRS